jgi:hypothetical protein
VSNALTLEEARQAVARCDECESLRPGHYATAAISADCLRRLLAVADAAREWREAGIDQYSGHWAHRSLAVAVRAILEERP